MQLLSPCTVHLCTNHPLRHNTSCYLNQDCCFEIANYTQQTVVNIKSPHILRQCFKIIKIFIPIENSHIFIPIFRVFKYIYTEFICKDIFTIVVWVLTPSEKWHKAARSASRLIEAQHVPQSPSKKCCFPWLEIEVNWGASRCIIITHINRYCAICRQGLFRAHSGHWL